MKWIVLGTWIAAILFAHLRGRVRLPLGRQLLDHSIILAPINAFMVLTSRVPTTPYIPNDTMPELKLLEDNWETIRDEALHLASLREIKAPELHNDIGFNSFFKYGWKRFYLKWYDAKHPSAVALCPKTVALLNQIPSVKAAMFAELPPGGQLNPHRDPFAGSLRYHLGLATPNDDLCYIDVDGIRHSWRDGKASFSMKPISTMPITRASKIASFYFATSNAHLNGAGPSGSTTGLAKSPCPLQVRPMPKPIRQASSIN